MTTPKPGVYPDVPEAEYHAWEAFSQSAAKELLRSPAHFRQRQARGYSVSDAMALGTAVHGYVLEPERGDEIAERALRSTATKHRDAWIVENLEKARSMRDAVAACDDATPLLRGTRELSVVWVCPKSGVLCKARLDVLGAHSVTDLKTAQEVNPRWFSRQARTLGYHVQAAWYIEAGEIALREMDTGAPQTFYIVAVESSAPWSVVPYRLGNLAIESGRALMMKARRDYALCRETGTWPGYGGGVRLLEISTYQADEDLEYAKEGIDVDSF